MEAIILCGGLGTRLRSLYPDTPKALADVGGRSFLDVLLVWLRGQGVRRIILAVGHLSEQVEQWVQAHGCAGLEIVLSDEPSPMGTGGAVALAFEQAQAERVLVLNGDSLCPIDLGEFLACHLRHPDTPMIAATRVQNAGSFGVLAVDDAGWITDFFTQASDDSAPGVVNSGLYWIPTSVGRALAKGQVMSLENDVFPQWQEASHGLQAFVHDVPFLDIGTPERIQNAEAFLARIEGQELKGKHWGTPVRMDLA